MRIRSIKPEFWRSDDVAALDWETRLIFIGLWSYVDDNGVGRDNERLILADLFPLEDDPRETLARVSRALETLSNRQMITRFTAGNRDLLHITNWSNHQKVDRPAKPRFPTPTSERESLATPSRESRETLAPGTRDLGNKGSGRERARESRDEDSAEPPSSIAPPRCPKHENNPTDEACGPCAGRRKTHELEQARRGAAAKAARLEATRSAAAARAKAIAACRLCDEHGYTGTAVCDHDPARGQTTRRGLAAVRAAIHPKPDNTEIAL